MLDSTLAVELSAPLVVDSVEEISELVVEDAISELLVGGAEVVVADIVDSPASELVTGELEVPGNVLVDGSMELDSLLEADEVDSPCAEDVDSEFEDVAISLGDWTSGEVDEVSVGAGVDSAWGVYVVIFDGTVSGGKVPAMAPAT